MSELICADCSTAFVSPVHFRQHSAELHATAAKYDIEIQGWALKVVQLEALVRRQESELQELRRKVIE